ncbi:MAG: M16 family metallopeptidase, partial [Myxococcales bacterium]
MKRALAAALILAGCASTPAAPPSTQPAASPAVACPGDAPAREGWFRLPDPLKTHPDAVSIAPLPFDPPAAAVRTLANGMQVYLLEDHTVPLVTVHALVRVGAVDDPVGKEGLAELTISGMRVAGAGKRSAEQVDDELEFMAASLEGGASEELAQFSLNVPTASLDAALAIFADVLLAPRFEDKPLQRIFERAREGIRRREDSPGGLASRALQRAVYGPAHPLAREPSLKSLASIRRQDLQATHAATIVPAATRLMVSGDFQPDEMLQRLEQRFGGWKGGPGVVRKLPPPQGASKRRVANTARAPSRARPAISSGSAPVFPFGRRTAN